MDFRAFHYLNGLLAGQGHLQQAASRLGGPLAGRVSDPALATVERRLVRPRR